MDLHLELQKAEQKVAALKKAIKQEERDKMIGILTRHKTRAQVFTSTEGNLWYKFSVKEFGKTPAFATDYFLTDLKGNYIADKLDYEGRPCKPGWAVGAYYCATEQRAINCFEETPEYARRY